MHVQVIESALQGERDAQARRAACYLVGLLLQSLGCEAIVVLSPPQLARIYRRLKVLRDDRPAAGADPTLQGHVHAALEQLRLLGLALVRGVDEDGTPREGSQTRSPLDGPIDSNALLSELHQLAVRMP